MTTRSSPPQGPLAGVRILDLSTVVAGPFGTALCADLGADVTKIELPDGSDALRKLQPVKGDMPLYWKVTNRGKRGITLDVRKPAGRALLLRLIELADVLVENFRPGKLEEWGLDIATLQGVNPRLNVLRLTGFGQTGPYRQNGGFARVFEAMSGLTNLCGEVGRMPLHMNFPLGDTVAGTFAAFAISAEMVRMRSDPRARGVEIDLSATEALFRMLEPLAVEHEQLGIVRGHNGNRATYTAPSNMYLSADGVAFSLVASSEPIFRRLCAMLGMETLTVDPRFVDNLRRVRHGEALDAILAHEFAQMTFEQLDARLTTAGVPHTKIYTIEDIVADPHFTARDAVIRLPDPDLGTIPAPCIVPRVKGREMRPPRSGPSVGEHNAQVYGELGLDEAALARLKREQVI
ncbi:CoA transferase [Paraburkholderia sp. NMBU_R16]|uniref:CaiB/BaiF CoA transferase family protein n=1 Tax=Paraburkholderia sp. NMBU_R16 TaxID=2698676 RepID=UPI001564F910|nr:CaiB/BaiF CoA-transferase family protein [Paraburkholderia sp. NMBU_R16]NRO98879.1 CoA transferase [Paraburkholderia sp. NMBU_R16]